METRQNIGRQEGVNIMHPRVFEYQPQGGYFIYRKRKKESVIGTISKNTLEIQIQTQIWLKNIKFSEMKTSMGW